MIPMQLSENFSLAEFCASDTASRCNIDNGLPLNLVANAYKTAAMLEQIRSHLSSLAGRTVPVHITSGYRCLELNRRVGSRDTSDHMQAMAADFHAPAFGTPLEVCRALAPVISVLGIGAIIYEHTWTHVSAVVPDKVINRILTVQGRNYVPGIVESIA